MTIYSITLFILLGLIVGFVLGLLFQYFRYRLTIRELKENADSKEKSFLNIKEQLTKEFENISLKALNYTTARLKND